MFFCGMWLRSVYWWARSPLPLLAWRVAMMGMSWYTCFTFYMLKENQPHSDSMGFACRGRAHSPFQECLLPVWAPSAVHLTHWFVLACVSLPLSLTLSLPLSLSLSLSFSFFLCLSMSLSLSLSLSLSVCLSVSFSVVLLFHGLLSLSPCLFFCCSVGGGGGPSRTPRRDYRHHPYPAQGVGGGGGYFWGNALYVSWLAMVRQGCHGSCWGEEWLQIICFMLGDMDCFWLAMLLWIKLFTFLSVQKMYF